MTVKKIGLLGGTFDPVHYGHLELAESALMECGLDKVIFIPAAEPPHKTSTAVSTFGHRLAMLELATQGMKGFECNAIEGLLPKPSYTIDTLRVLQRHYQEDYNNDYQLYFMIGADAFLDILTWKSHRDVLLSVHILLSRRKGYTGERLVDLLKNLGYREGKSFWCADDDKKDIYILERTPGEQSSSGIRGMIAKGESVERFLPPSVLLYIQKNKLYHYDGVVKTSQRA